MDCNPPGSSVHGIIPTRILEWAAVSFSRGSSPPRDKPGSPALAGVFFTAEPSGKPIHTAAAAAAKSLQSCPTLRNLK